MTRIMGLLLAAVATQFILRGFGTRSSSSTLTVGGPQVALDCRLPTPVLNGGRLAAANFQHHPIMTSLAIQDFYPEDFAHCYGCGRLNAHGMQIKSRWDGDGPDVVTVYTPRPDQIGVPGFAYGGLIASLIDCHAMGTAAAAAERAAGRAIGDGPAPRFVTASLKVDYLKPTPSDALLEIRARAREVGARKVIVDATVSARGVVTAKGEVVAVRIPETMKNG